MCALLPQEMGARSPSEDAKATNTDTALSREEVAGVEHRGSDCGRELTDSASENLGRGSTLPDPSPWPPASAGETAGATEQRSGVFGRR